eukprot:577432-Lingulodinium_polyedra.AAC.1
MSVASWKTASSSTSSSGALSGWGADALEPADPEELTMPSSPPSSWSTAFRPGCFSNSVFCPGTVLRG